MSKKQPKSEAMLELERVWREYIDKRYASMPQYARVYEKFSEDSTNELDNCIKKYIQARGGHAYGINSMGVKRTIKSKNPNIKDKEIWTKGRSKGVADIEATVNGYKFSIEVKYGKDTLKESQKKFIEKELNAGGMYFIAKSFTDIKPVIDKFFELPPLQLPFQSNVDNKGNNQSYQTEMFL